MESCFERALAAQCAPTLAGLKPGSLFRIGGDPAAMRQTVDLWDQRLSPRGIRVRILKECPAAQACMIYVYRSGWVDPAYGAAGNSGIFPQDGLSAREHLLPAGAAVPAVLSGTGVSP